MKSNQIKSGNNNFKIFPRVKNALEAWSGIVLPPCFLCLVRREFVSLARKTNENLLEISLLLFALSSCRWMRNSFNSALQHKKPTKNNGRTNTNATESAVLFAAAHNRRRKAYRRECKWWVEARRKENQKYFFSFPNQQWQVLHEYVIYFLMFALGPGTKQPKNSSPHLRFT